MLESLLLILIAASWLYWLVAEYLVRSFFRNPALPSNDFLPGVSILKPVKGLDAQAYQNFASFCRQEYPNFELLFGVTDLNDPALPVIERLCRDYPERHIRLCVAPTIGSNRKVSILHYLAAQARHDVLVVSDSDMRVTPDYLRQVVSPLADERVGLVTCPYRGEHPLTFTARLEALHMGATFLPSVVVARKFLSMRFALGATVALRRADLARLGGFAALADYLADDFQLGEHITNLGLRVCLSRYIVASVLGATTFREQWDREVRWARGNRVSRPIEYPGLLLSFSTPLAVMLALITDFAAQSLLVLALSILLRWQVAWQVASCTNDRAVHQWIVWLPLRDLLSALVWCVGGVGRRVVWRGEEYHLLVDGRLRTLPSVSAYTGTEGIRHRFLRR